MELPVNKFKASLKLSTTQVGCWAGMADAYATEMLGTCGFDWILIDGEHAPNDIRSALSQLQALGSSSSSPVVRLPVGSESLVKQYLDIGAQSLMIPMIESVEAAESMVRAVQYPPRGRRGVGAALARASSFSGIPDYIRKAENEICLILQVENQAGLAALDGILKLEGVDGVFIGPADLAADMGYPGQTAHPEVRSKVMDALAKIQSAGKAAGVMTLDEGFAEECLKKNIDFIAVGIDVIEFVKALRNLASKYVNRV